MNPKRAPGAEDDPSTTLGDLVYSDRADAIPEADWVGLVEAIAAGDQRALKALYERTHRLVFTLSMRICSNRQMAEEVTVDVFHEVWRRSSRFDETDGSVIGWIMNQARSRAIDRVRFEQRKKRVPPATDLREEPIVSAAPSDALESERHRELLRGALAELTPDERQAVETAFFSELTYAETADHLSVPLGTVKTRIRSALAKLRAALDRAGGGR